VSSSFGEEAVENINEQVRFCLEHRRRGNASTYRRDSRRDSVLSLLSGVSFARRIASIACIGDELVSGARESKTVETNLVQQNVVGAAERATSLLKSFTDRIDLYDEAHCQLTETEREKKSRDAHAEMSTDLLIDDSADKTSRNIPSSLRRQQLRVSQLRQLLLLFRCTGRDDFG